MIVKVETEGLEAIAGLAKSVDIVDRLTTQFKGEIDTHDLRWLKASCERLLELPLFQAISTEGL